MPTGRWVGWGAIATLAVAMAFALVRQHDEHTALRAEIARGQARVQELKHLQAEHMRLLAAQPTDAQLEAAAANLELADELRAQLARLQRRGETLAAEVAAEAEFSSKKKSAPISLVGVLVAANLWQNAGRTTPANTLQTALWAAAHGDLEALAACLMFDPETRLRAGAAFARLAPALQQELGTPERMIALLSAAEVPLGRAAILKEYPGNVVTKLAVQVIDDHTGARTAVLALEPVGNEWRIKVPPSAVKRYSALLGISPASIGAGK